MFVLYLIILAILLNCRTKAGGGDRERGEDAFCPRSPAHFACPFLTSFSQSLGYAQPAPRIMLTNFRAVIRDPRYSARALKGAVRWWRLFSVTYPLCIVAN